MLLQPPHSLPPLQPLQGVEHAFGASGPSAAARWGELRDFLKGRTRGQSAALEAPQEAFLRLRCAEARNPGLGLLPPGDDRIAAELPNPKDRLVPQPHPEEAKGERQLHRSSRLFRRDANDVLLGHVSALQELNRETLAARRGHEPVRKHLRLRLEGDRVEALREPGGGHGGHLREGLHAQARLQSQAASAAAIVQGPAAH